MLRIKNCNVNKCQLSITIYYIYTRLEHITKPIVGIHISYSQYIFENNETNNETNEQTNIQRLWQEKFLAFVIKYRR